MKTFEKVNSYGILSPRIKNPFEKNNKNKFTLKIESNKIENKLFINPINLYYYSPKNISKRNYSKISNVFTPRSTKFSKNSSQRNLNWSRPQSCLTSDYTSLDSMRRKSYFRNRKKKNISLIEKEKLYQETFQMNQEVKVLTKKLFLLKKENLIRDKEIKTKEKKINDIILNNNESFDDKKIFGNNTTIHDNEFDSKIENVSNEIDGTNYSKFLNNKNNINPFLKLYIKIKKAIKEKNKEIKTESENLEKLKKSFMLTKLTELFMESNLLEEQISKINTFIEKGILIHNINSRKKEQYMELKANINKQENIINNLIDKSNFLEFEEKRLKGILSENQKQFNFKSKIINTNNLKLKALTKKNSKLIKDKALNNENMINSIEGNQLGVKNYYTDKISKLNKLINFYKSQNKYSGKEIDRLKEQRTKLFGKKNSNEKDYTLKQYQLLSVERNNENTQIGNINNLRETLQKLNEEDDKLLRRLQIYQKKLKEIEPPQISDGQEEGDDFSSKSKIEFGIDGDNPYYTDNNENIPEETNKFTSAQFNQFTYILFKNFESKGISFEESKEKVINFFFDFNRENNIEKVIYPSKEFDFIVENYTNIILKVLNRNNKYNFALTKIFLSALFYNSECDVNRLIEYFSILFTYTQNYSIDEKKYIDKLRSKYKTEAQKLISSIKDNIVSQPNSYYDLIKMKELLEANKIKLKDKYIEFLFYYMKKFDEPESKLGDLKLSLLNNILPLENEKTTEGNKINSPEKKNEEENSNNKEKAEKENNENNNEENLKEKSIKFEKDDSVKKVDRIEKKTLTQDNAMNREKNINTDDFEEEEDSMTEITNEEYIKQLMEAMVLIEKGLKKEKITFDELMSNVIQKRKITGKIYECIAVEDFNEQLKSRNIILSDLKLSCLCSKYSIPNELRLIDKQIFNEDIQKQMQGKLKYDEEEDEKII